MTQDKSKVLWIRALHGLITVYFLSCIGYVYYAAFTGDKGVLAYISVISIILEGVVVLLNKGNCPLGEIHKRVGDDKAFFELFLPKPLAKLAIPIFGFIAGVGIVVWMGR